ncbi:MAG: Na/Pi cotransporter family protein [Firmicutes bacterium]|nr:Na/Pi cotransporter family protein [Bacillota bacterium]
MRELIFGVVGGLAIFIYGMDLMSEGLKKVAGERLRKILEAVTKNPLIGVIVGTVVTAVIQSSSATTVMVIGFVNAGLMNLQQAIGVIMGANIGTTITAQIIAFKLDDYAYLIAGLGFALYFFGKKKFARYLGQVIFGFGLLFVGINTMSTVLKPLASNPTSLSLITKVSNTPFWGVLVGIVITVVVQSSSAVIGVLQSLASQPVVVDGAVRALIPLEGAVPILLGSNIGTTITAILASIGANNAAKRSALSHTLFNVLGTVICLLFLTPFILLVYRISPAPNPAGGITAADVVSRQIANAHTSFNAVNTLIWLPFTNFLARLVTRMLPGEEPIAERKVRFLETHVLNNADIALNLSAKELLRMGKISQEMLADVENYLHTGEAEDDPNGVQEKEDTLDYLQTEITHYLSTIVSRNTLTERQSNLLAHLMHITGDLERIGDHCTNIKEQEVFLEKDHITFSEMAVADLKKVFDLTNQMFTACLGALEKNSAALAMKVLEMESELDVIEKEARVNHLERLSVGACNPKAAISFNELMRNLERIADHCNNIAEAVLDQISVGR